LKLDGTHQLFVYADNVNIVGVSVHTIKKNKEALVVASKEIGLEVNKFMSRNQNTGSSRDTKMVSSSLERMKEFMCLGTTLANQNSIQE
jgi:hypothetical protein